MPLAKYFKTEADYMAVLCHEFFHYTMHEKRLNRIEDFRKENGRAKEELLTEISCTILLKHFGISGEVANHENYIESWLQNLTDNDFCEAVKKSVKVISYILNVEAEDEYKEKTFEVESVLVNF